jgi:hypothetical protein
MTLPSGSDTDASNRPRRRWNRYVVAGIVLAVLALAGFSAMAVAFNSAKRTLAAQVAARRAAGEPILPEDWKTPPVPEEQNAAFHLDRAADAAPDINYNRGGPQTPLYLALETWPLTEEQMAAAGKALAEHAGALSAAHAARACRDADWGIRWERPMDQFPPHLGGQRRLTTFLKLSARYQHQSGDDAAAVETLRDLLAIPRAIDRQSFLIAHLTGMTITSVAADAVLDVAEKMRVGPRDSSQGKPATPHQVRALIADLLDDESRRIGVENCWRGERMRALDLADFKAQQAAPYPAYRLRREAVLMLRAYDAALAAALEPRWPAAKPKLMPAPPTISDDAATLFPNRNVVNLDFRLWTERRAGAVALAARLYAADHGGKLPGRMEDLAPKYLPAPPADPFAADASALRLMSRETGIVVYSVAENGSDDGGDETLPVRRFGGYPGLYGPGGSMPATPVRNVVDVVGNWKTPDAVFHLTARTRVPEPETSPADAESNGAPDASDEKDRPNEDEEEHPRA